MIREVEQSKQNVKVLCKLVTSEVNENETETDLEVDPSAEEFKGAPKLK